MAMRIVKDPITRKELAEMASEEYGDVVKAVVDVGQGIVAVGGELHADEEVLLMEQEKSQRGDTWGINLYVKNPGEDWIEFDSMVNLKPAFGNRSRGVDNKKTQDKIREVISKLITE